MSDCPVCEHRERRLRLFKGKQSRAKSRGVEWDLDFDDIHWPEFCPVLGIELDYGASWQDKSARECAPSFDRLDAAKGYVKGNVAIISMRANRIKNDATAEELVKVADWTTRMGL